MSQIRLKQHCISNSGEKSCKGMDGDVSRAGT